MSESIFILFGSDVFDEDEIEDFLEGEDLPDPIETDIETLGIFKNAEEAKENSLNYNYLNIFVEEWEFKKATAKNAWLREDDEWKQVVCNYIVIDEDIVVSEKSKSMMN